MTEVAARRVGPSNVHQHCADGLPGHPIDRVRVVTRYGNYSAFNGYRFTSSDYSSCRCEVCGTYWRTNAAYVEVVPDAH